MPLRIHIIFILLFSSFKALAGDIDFAGNNILIGKYVKVLEDPKNELQYPGIITSNDFIQSKVETSNFGISKSVYWIKFTIKNLSNENNLLLQVEYPMLESATLYSKDTNTVPQSIFEKDAFIKRKVRHEDLVFNISLNKNESQTYFLKIKGNEQIIVPLILGTELSFMQLSLTKEIIAGIHIGILLVMILYNLFIYFAIKDKSYLYYVLYILSIGLTQTAITGYTFKYLWPTFPNFNHFSIILFPAFAGSFAIIFVRHFLQTKERAPSFDRFINIFIYVYAFAVILRLVGDDRLSYRIIDFTGLTGAFFVLIMSIKLSIKNFRPAKFFMVAWTIFLIGIVLYVLRNLNILPYSIYTNYTMQAGTAIEVILLSFALADKINILTAEKELSQAEALKISIENQRIIKEQNIVLEQKVKERTTELTYTNTELESTLTRLKNTQTQLVDAEKMASLGQLTAGIAHEINNPINFVSSNIQPLKRDIDDLWQIVNNYEQLDKSESLEAVKAKLSEIEKLKIEIDVEYLKTEITTLLDGMQEGVKRTVEIVKGLKVFSRIDESDLKFANINSGILSTLIILNNQMSNRLKLIKDLGNLPDIECFAGKLNQVFMNILSNAIFATESNPKNRPATIWVKTYMVDETHVSISIRDNGTGMADDVKNKIFEPFFTTKEVGKGTGLGLSIVFQIIEMHGGKLDVKSKLNEGTEFLITLPIFHKTKIKEDE